MMIAIMMIAMIIAIMIAMMMMDDNDEQKLTEVGLRSRSRSFAIGNNKCVLCIVAGWRKSRLICVYFALKMQIFLLRSKAISMCFLAHFR